MLVNLYRAKTPIAVFSLPLFIGLLSLSIFFLPNEAEAHFWNWQNWVDEFISSKAWLEYITTVLIVSLNAHQINNIYNRHTFYSKATFLPGMIYAIALFSLGYLNFSPELIAHLFIILALGQFFKLRRQDGAKVIIFWGALFLGIAMIFSTFSALLILLPFISLVIFRPFVWREWFLVIMGFLLPVFYYLAIMYMIKGGFDFNIAELTEREPKSWDLFSAANIGIFAIIYLAANYKYIVIMRTEINRFRKQSMVIFHFSWIAAAIWFIGYQFFNHTYLSFTIPYALVLATPFLHAKRNSIVNLVVIIWLIISVANIYLVR